MQDIYEKLEFQKIRETVASFARSEKGKNRLLGLMAFEDEGRLDEEKKRLNEAISLLSSYGRIPLDVSSDLSSYVALAKKGGVLGIEELERVSYDIIEGRGLKQYFQKVTNSPLLVEYASTLPSLDFIEKDIHKVIAPDMSIFDSASPKLRGIRGAIRKAEAEMKRKLGYILGENKDYLSDTTLTMRNGHYVLPVANAYKNRVKGIIQDVSGSGETTFIEPDKIVELNNRMYELKNEEREEIRRLLLMLSQEVASNSDEIIRNNEMIGYLDFLQAKALYSESVDGHVAFSSDTPFIEIFQGRHPLIDKEKVVANDFSLTPKTSLIVISGPNAGGKTVALKTLGILVLMNQCGLPVLAKEGTTISFFKHIYVDIGDSQSISDNLSTFSGHMANIGSILSSVGGRDLVLLDEVGTGTSPKEGEAVAFAVISYLLRKHAFTMASSHFEGIKAYALSHEEIINASMVFDEKNLVPTYRLKMGLPGESYGLLVAKRFGLPQEVLDFASDYLSKHEETSVTDAIKRLGEVTRLTEIEKETLKKKETEAERQLADLKKKEDKLAYREAHYLQDVEEKKNEMLASYEKQMEEILHSVSNGDKKLHEVIKAKKELDDLREEASETHYNEKVEVGDYVNIPSVYSSGRVLNISGKKVEVATSDGLTFKVTMDRVVKVEEPKEEKTREVGNRSGVSIDDVAFQERVPLELNLIGQRYEEAKLNLDKYLDKCRMKGWKRVRIIHGFGSGVLRGLVNSYVLSHKDFILRQEAAGPAEGAGGATILYLK